MHHMTLILKQPFVMNYETENRKKNQVSTGIILLITHVTILFTYEGRFFSQKILQH